MQLFDQPRAHVVGHRHIDDDLGDDAERSLGKLPLEDVEEIERVIITVIDFDVRIAIDMKRVDRSGGVSGEEATNFAADEVLQPNEPEFAVDRAARDLNQPIQTAGILTRAYRGSSSSACSWMSRFRL